MRGKELKENVCNQRDSFSKKKEVFLKKFIPKHPPILGEWFRKTFPDAQVNSLDNKDGCLFLIFFRVGLQLVLPIQEQHQLYQWLATS